MEDYQTNFPTSKIPPIPHPFPKQTQPISKKLLCVSSTFPSLNHPNQYFELCDDSYPLFLQKYSCNFFILITKTINRFSLAMLQNFTRYQEESSKSDIFKQITPHLDEFLQYQTCSAQNQFAILGQPVRLQFYERVLKLTYLAPRDEQQSIPLVLELNYDLKVGMLTSPDVMHFPISQISRKNLIGFSIFKNAQNVWEFISQDKKIIHLWIDQLARHLFLSGFSNQFKSIKYIARGEFAQVWETERLRDGKRFAVKIIDKDTCFGEVKGKEAVYNEIQTLRKINHPNITSLECIYESDKNMYLVLDFIPGFVLSDVIRKKRTGSESASSSKIEKIHNINILKDLLKTVKYLHDLGIAHRDIKPGNIIIDHTNNWKPHLIDFGLSEFTSKEEHLFRVCGSPGYMAPEMFEDGDFLDLQKCDVFSLGAIFYLILTHEPLFDGNTTEQIYRQTKDSKNFIKKKLTKLNTEAEVSLISEMLDVNPTKRLSAEQALSHDYFMEASYDYLNELRKPSTDEEKSMRFSVKQKKIKSRFEQLFSESAIFTGFKLNFINEEDKENSSTSQNTSFNMVEPSEEFIRKIKRRSSRFMSEQNIDIDGEEKMNKDFDKGQFGGKRHLKGFDRVSVHQNLWMAKDYNAFS